jgi:hypothetical protein
MLNNATESSRACGCAGVIPPFLWFRVRPMPPRSGVLDQATLALLPLNRCQIRRREATRHPGSAAALHPGRAHQPSPDGNRLAISFVRQHGDIYMLEGFDESISWFDRLMRRF